MLLFSGGLFKYKISPRFLYTHISFLVFFKDALRKDIHGDVFPTERSE